MAVPIQNIYYLLCYSWNKLEEKNVVDVDATTCNNVVDLFAKVLINGCTHLFKKGLDRHYLEIAAPIQGIKGKVNFAESLKQDLFSKAQAVCTFDELDYNVLHNQILKSSIGNLVRVKTLDKDLKVQLRGLYRKFQGVDHIQMTTQDFSKIALHRNNGFYDFLLKVCRILHDNILITEDEGKYTFRDFLLDEKRMRVVFEHFVRNFYRKHLPKKYKIKPETIQWNASATNGNAMELLPQMRTDISMELPDRKIIIDTKYYAETLSVYYEKERIRSPHLYQLFAYLKNIAAKGGLNTHCEGILLYPTVSNELSETFNLDGHKVSVYTLNLNQHWQNIHDDLLKVIA